MNSLLKCSFLFYKTCRIVATLTRPQYRGSQIIFLNLFYLSNREKLSFNFCFWWINAVLFISFYLFSALTNMHNHYRWWPAPNWPSECENAKEKQWRWKVLLHSRRHTHSYTHRRTHRHTCDTFTFTRASSAQYYKQFADRRRIKVGECVIVYYLDARLFRFLCVAAVCIRAVQNQYIVSSFIDTAFFQCFSFTDSR